MYVVSDLVLPVIPPFALLSLRLMIAVMVLGIVVWRSGIPVRLTSSQWRSVLLIGLIGFGVSLGAQFVGTDASNAVNGSLITSASPAFILLFAALILRERLTPTRIVSVLLATLGVIVIIDPTQADFSSATFFGNVMLAIAALTWGLYSVLVRQATQTVDTTLFSWLAPVGGLFLTLPAAFAEAPSRPIGTITPAVILGVLYLGVISTAVAMWLWNRAFALVDASTASLFFFAQPVVGVLLGLLLGQPLTAAIVIGGALITIGVLFSILNREKKVTSFE